MNGSELYTTLAGMMSALEQVFFFLAVIFILLAGAWVTAIFSGSHEAGSQGLGAQGSGAQKTDQRKKSPSKDREQQKKIIRHLNFHRVQGDEFGFLGERLLQSLRQEFASSLWSKWTGANKMSYFQIATGLTGKKQPLKANDTQSTHQEELSLNGSVKNKKVSLRFFPSSPLHVTSSQDKKSSLYEKSPQFVYDCSDFPLFELKELSLEYQGDSQKLKAEDRLFQVMVAGLMNRGFGADNQIVSLRKLSKWAKQLDKYLDRKTKSNNLEKAPPTSSETEMIVATAWCYLVAGLGLHNEAKLKRSLELYQQLSEDHWHGREKTEMAGAQANEAYAAFALMQLNPANPNYANKTKLAVAKSIRNFRRDNFPHCWGKLMCKLALAETSQGENEPAELEEPCIKEVLEASHSIHAIELSLDEAIEAWRKTKQDDAMCEAYFAKGKLALNSARRNMGVQGLERAENGFLAALSLSNEARYGKKFKFLKINRSDIRLELGKLYLSWGTRFGEAELIEKAIHQFEALREEKRFASKNSNKETSLALADCYLNFGGITNKADHHKQAIFRYNDCLDQGVSGHAREKIERSLTVARARLALVVRSKEQVETAISSICAVIGQNGNLWPTKDVLLRLRARLRELLFVLEGDDIALDRAIKDRRELVKLAETGVQDVRWAVEVSDLVNLLSKRQYKNNGKPEDFNEAHYLLETAISIVEKNTETANPEFDIPHIRGTLYVNLAKLLASFARVHFDEQALKEAASYYEKYIKLTPRAVNPRKRAEILSQIGLIMMDLSEQYGAHGGLKQAISCFAEAHDIYLEAGLIDLSNRMRRFLENAQAANLAYQLPDEASS